MRTPVLGVVAVCASTGLACGEVIFLSQDRRVVAHTTHDGGLSEVAATGFGPFEAEVVESTLFPAPDGPAVNRARAGISCTFEFGRIRASGSLEGRGGVEGGGALVFGQATVIVAATMKITDVAEWRVRSSSLDGSGGGAEGGGFSVRITSLDDGRTIFSADSDGPLDACDVVGTMLPGTYEVEYITTLRSGGDRRWDSYDFEFRAGEPECDGDVNCDFALDGFDVEVQEKAVGGDMADYCRPDPDFNRDFALDGFDVEAVEVVVGGGPCP